MGTFAGLYGEYQIPEGKKEEFTELVMRILYKGGMMQFEPVTCHGIKIHLIHPFRCDANGWARGHYNYIDDNGWETISYNRNTGRFFSGKIGGSAFYKTVISIYILQEIFCDYRCVAHVDGELFSGRPYLGWINQITGKSYTNGRALDPWSLLEYIHDDNPDYLNNISARDLLSLTNSGRDSDYDRFMTALHVLMGSEAFDEFFKSYKEKPFQYQLCKEYIEPVKNIGLETLLKLCFQNKNDKTDRLQSEKDDKLKYYIIRTLIVHPASIVKGLSEMFKTDFWELWEIWKKQTDVYNFTLIVKEKQGVPERYPTSNMMDVSDSHPAFWDAHRESLENYHLSDDDLLYYWEPERDDIRISSNVKKWLFALKRQLHAIAGEQKYMFSNQEFRQKLTDLLYMCEDHYKRIYAFESMYDDFLDHSDDLMYQAALIVFGKVVEENWEAGKEIEKFTGSWWDLCDRNITCNSGRMTVKRYLAVMANRDLRSKYLGF